MIKKSESKKIEITQKGNPILRKTLSELPAEEIRSEHIRQTIAQMSEALYQSSNGIGIAAPQIGISLPIFLVSEEALAHDDGTPHDHTKDRWRWRHFVYINPKLIKSSQKKVLLDEGCLSVEGMFGKVLRARQVTVEALNEQGKKFRVGASGLFAQVLQHEIDHLNGILFTDKAKILEKLPSLTDAEQQNSPKK